MCFTGCVGLVCVSYLVCLPFMSFTWHECPAKYLSKVIRVNEHFSATGFHLIVLGRMTNKNVKL